MGGKKIGQLLDKKDVEQMIDFPFSIGNYYVGQWETLQIFIHWSVSSSAQSDRSGDMGAFHRYFLVQRDPQECLHDLQPTSGYVLSMHPLLEAKSFCRSSCVHGLLTTLPKNAFEEDHSMLVVILCTG